MAQAIQVLFAQQQLAWWGVGLLIRSTVLSLSWCGCSLASYALLRSSVDIRLLLLCPASAATADAVQEHHTHAQQTTSALSFCHYVLKQRSRCSSRTAV
jgi:hypothetical protein